MEITLKFTKKRVIAGVATLAVVGTMVGFAAPGGGGPSGGGMGGGNMGGGSGAAAEGTVRTVTLEKRDLASSISATGTIYSSNTTDVYSNQSYPVASVNVSVGDQVEAGDVLAVLDSTSLQSDIAQKRASLSSSQQSAQQSLKSAQLELETYQKNLQNNYDTNLINAENAVETAEIEYENAKLDVESAEREVNAARRKYAETRDTYSGDSEGAITISGNVTSTDFSSQLDELLDTVNQKEISLEKAISNQDKAKTNLDKAKVSLAAAKESADDSIVTYENKVESAQVSSNFTEQSIAIQKLESDLADCTIKAPVSGTITAVNAVEGASGSGQLFVIQSEGDLKIITYIKEYDIAAVNVGSKVTIATDATGDEEFVGTLSKIAPTSTLTATGETTSSTDAEYEAEVTVSTGSDKLRIGMNAQLSIITEERTDVFAVPYEAVDTDDMGRAFLYQAVKGDDGYTAQAVVVEQGMETDLYVEVSGDSLAEGMMIVKSVAGIEEGQALDIPDMPSGGRPEGMAPDGEDSGERTRPEGGGAEGERPGGMGMGRPE